MEDSLPTAADYANASADAAQRGVETMSQKVWKQQETTRRMQEQIDRVRALAEEAFQKGMFLQQIPETKLAGLAYVGMAQRILGALAGEDA